jgi:hypothetical protein
MGPLGAGVRCLHYRFLACAEADDVFRSSLSAVGPGPPQPERARHPGRARFALTKEYAAQPGALRPPGDDPRGLTSGNGLAPGCPDLPMTRPFAILVPWDEVIDRGYVEKGDVIWTAAPPKGMVVEYGIVAAAGLTVDGYPGARSMGSELVGKVDLANGEQVFVVAWTHEMQEETRSQIERFRGAKILDAEGKPVPNTGLLAFGVEQDGLGFFIDVTTPTGT